MLVKLLKAWGMDGFLCHTCQVAEFYRQKRDSFEISLRRHLTGLAEWSTPNAAMFFWLKLHLRPSVHCENMRREDGDSAILVTDRAIDKGVLFLPGECAHFDERKSCHVRLSFSLLSAEEADMALQRLAELLREA